MSRGRYPSVASSAWASRLGRVPDRHRGVTFARARLIALAWCSSGLADRAVALDWCEIELFGVRSWHPFRQAPLRGAALTGWPRAVTDRGAYFHDGRIIRRGQFGPDFIPVWCLDRRLRRPERPLVQMPSGLWVEAANHRQWSLG